MTDELIEAVTSLSMILDEENDRLTSPGFDPIPGELVAAKLRHVGMIEAAGVRLGQQGDVAPEAVERLGALIPEMLAKVEVNAALLRRRIAICDDLMGAISAEARRLSGARSTTYGAQGAMFRSDQATPIAINGQF